MCHGFELHITSCVQEQLAAKTSIFSLFFQGLSPSMDLLFEGEYRGAEDRAEGISVSYSSEVR